MTHLSVGDIAPDITGNIQDGTSFDWKQLKGKGLILFFYPKDNTPGCTAEACSLRDSFEALRDKGYELLGVSADSEKKHQNFISKFSLPFDLLADTEKEILNAFGVWGPKKFIGKTYDGIHRTTFVIGSDKKIQHIYQKVKTKSHADQILADL